MSKALFLDRDGILNHIILRGETIGSPRKYEEFRLISEAIPLVKMAKELGFFTILVTNQPDISRNKMTRYQLSKMHREILKQIPLDRIEICTSSNDSCYRRKPNPGMLLQSAQKLGIDLSQSFFLGDSFKDVLAGRKAGVKTILFQTDYNVKHHGTADFNCNNFHEITKIILQHKETT